jgi:hypothetical protein
MPSTESVSHDDLLVCACGEREYKAREAIDAALWRGELDASWKAFLTRTEAEKQSEEQDLDFDDSELDTAAEAFRYEHDLITAEETEQWLAARGLTLEDFSNYFSRQYWGNRLSEEITPPEMEYAAAPRDLRQVFAAELILSGELEQLSTQLIWRLAAWKAEKEPNADGIRTEEENFFETHELKPAELPTWLNTIGRDPAWFAEMLAMEAAYWSRRETVLLPQARQRELATLRLPLTQFETEVLELESRDSAQEALFCVREDGMSMEEVAAEGRYPYRQVTFLLEDLPADLQQTFLSVSAGDILDPLVREDGFQLCRITKKIEPQADDPAIQSRVEQRLLNRYFSDLSSKYVERRLGAATGTE